MNSLKHSRQPLTSSLGVYRFVLELSRRLPNEILEIIFALCVDGDVDIQRYLGSPTGRSDCPSTLDTKKAPWVLGQVCRRWRYLVLSLANLWTAIDINCKEPSKEFLHPFIERRLSLTLQRSQNSPLYISWNDQSSRDRTVLSMLCSRTFQWKAATIRAGFRGLRLLSPYSGAFPILSTLHLDLAQGGWSELDENDAVFRIFQNAPSLRHVLLSGDCSEVSRLLNKQIHWNQIRQFTVKPCYLRIWGGFEILLPRLTNVEELTLALFGFVRSGDPPLELVHLHILDLWDLSILQYRQFVEFINTSLTSKTEDLMCFPSKRSPHRRYLSFLVVPIVGSKSSGVQDIERGRI